MDKDAYANMDEAEKEHFWYANLEEPEEKHFWYCAAFFDGYADAGWGGKGLASGSYSRMLRMPSAPSGQKLEFITAWFTPLLR